MSYTKHIWVDGSDPAINAQHLNEMEDGIEAAYQKPASGIPTSDLAIPTDTSTDAVRKIYAGTSDMTAGTTPLTTGVIYLVYE